MLRAGYYDVMKQQAKKYLEYRIVITPDTRTGSRRACFTAFVPVLGIAADGDTVEEAYENAKDLIVFHIESLKKERVALPVEAVASEFITTARVPIPV